MISHRTPRKRLPKMPKNIERLYKAGKCRDCAVVVTRMDFAKILGKFTKVKIQYESNSTPKTKRNEVTSPNSNARLKSNENGMVLLHRNAYNPHPVKSVGLPPTQKEEVKGGTKRVNSSTPRQASNVLKENNRLKKTPIIKDKNANLNISAYDGKSHKSSSHLKQYGIMFINPSQKKSNNDLKSKTCLEELLPVINKSILPNEEWSIEYLPIKDEPTDDKVYDRIAAELEDLMYNEKPESKPEGSEVSESKTDDFPSIMDILNDNASDSKKANDQRSSVEFKSNLESSDVEAMLLGKSSVVSAVKESTSMEVDTNDVSNLIEDVAQLNATVPSQDGLEASGVTEEFENPHSPSILDEALQKGIEEHLPLPSTQAEDDLNITDSQSEKKIIGETGKKEDTLNSRTNSKLDKTNKASAVNTEKKAAQRTDVTHVVFKKNVNGTCKKSVTCPKNMKYSTEINGKQVELIGAPKFISSVDDLQVLLQIIEDTELNSLYILY